MNAIKWGLIGASDVARTRMIPAITRRGDVINAVHSASEARATAFAVASGIRVGTSDLSRLLDADIDAVYISNTNERHFESAMAALTAGKHVLCEKPLALSVDEAQQMVDFAAHNKLVLATNHHLPGSPLHVAVRELVAQGAIGTALAARVNHAVMLPERLRGWRLGSSEGAGVILDITCHDASVLNPLFGNRPVRVSAIGVNQGPWNTSGSTDSVMTAIEYEQPTSGSLAAIHYDGSTPVIAQTFDAFTIAHSETSLEVHGTEGSIFVRDAMTQDTEGTVTLVNATGSSDVVVDCSRDLYTIVLEGFAGAIEGTGKPTCSGEDGVLALRVALAAKKSVEEGRVIEMSEV